MKYSPSSFFIRGLERMSDIIVTVFPNPISSPNTAVLYYYLFNKIVDSGKRIIAFDLNEVSCGEDSLDAIDASVGARILYRMCNLFMKSTAHA